jgi:hypothetical protein
MLFRTSSRLSGRSSRSNPPRFSPVCSPTPGMGAMIGSTPAGVAGGGSAHRGPAGDSTSRQQPRVFSCRWSRNCRTVRSRALAMPASSRRTMASFSVKCSNAPSISSCSASRFATRSEFVVNCALSANSGLSSTCSQNFSYSRSFYIPKNTLSPSPHLKGR